MASWSSTAAPAVLDQEDRGGNSHRRRGRFESPETSPNVPAARCDVEGRRRYRPAMDALVDHARQTAEQYLDTPRLADRWAHVRAVADRAGELAVGAGVSGSERELVVAAGLVHDVGYAAELVVTGFHPLDGARHLQRAGFPDRLVALVAHHSGARFEAAERGLLTELEIYPLEETTVMDILIAADLTTGPQGQALTFTERLDEILTRYPAGSVVHRAMARARPMLAAHLHRLGIPLSR
jgi:hypothetical protein